MSISLKPLAAALTALALVSGFLATGIADARVPNLFSDHMVLQQGSVAKIWGWADDNEVIEVELSYSVSPSGKASYTEKRRDSAVADEGKWEVSLLLPDNKAIGPIGARTPSITEGQLKISGNNEIIIKDVAIGEVWIASGQSNMQWSMSRSKEPLTAIASSTDSNLRLFYVPRKKSNLPLDEIEATWSSANAESVTEFSAVGYYFGRALQASTAIPVGIIHTSWGGSPAEVWLSNSVLESNPDYKKSILKKYDSDLKSYEDRVTAWEKRKKEDGEAVAGKAPGGRPSWKPSELYNGMIAPLIPYAINGAIWYQGESNAGRAWQYRTLFPDMIRNWRADWGVGDFTFLEVQLAPWDKNRKRPLEEIIAEPVESDWAELREAQLLATKILPKVGMAVITDIGEKDNIHPQEKQIVGERLTLAARAIALNEDIPYSGPVYKSMSISGSSAVLSFTHADTGLAVQGGTLTGFSICGFDQKFHWANARLSDDGHQVIVTHPNVSRPVAVRYGWDAYPVVNLWNNDGLPASPFRTDGFTATTQPK